MGSQVGAQRRHAADRDHHAKVTTAAKKMEEGEVTTLRQKMVHKYGVQISNNQI